VDGDSNGKDNAKESKDSRRKEKKAAKEGNHKRKHSKELVLQNGDDQETPTMKIIPESNGGPILLKENVSSDSNERGKNRNVPFSRIDQRKIVFADPSLQDNLYRGSDTDYAAQAYRDLVVTRGEGFRKEKGKKKRGSYRGGAISTEVKSFKF
jgi:hypothetical protein